MEEIVLQTAEGFRYLHENDEGTQLVEEKLVNHYKRAHYANQKLNEIRKNRQNVLKVQEERHNQRLLAIKDLKRKDSKMLMTFYNFVQSQD